MTGFNRPVNICYLLCPAHDANDPVTSSDDSFGKKLAAVDSFIKTNSRNDSKQHS